MEIHITKKDVLWGYIAQFFNIGAGILLLPVILKLLPADRLRFSADFYPKCRLCIQWCCKTSGQRSG